MTEIQRKISIILADDHPLVLRGLVDLLSGVPDFDVIAVASDGRVALDQIEEKQPDIAILDVVMPSLNGIDLLSELARNKSKVKVIFLSALINEDQILKAIAIGAWGILLKESAPETLVECMREVNAGRRWPATELFHHPHLVPEASHRTMNSLASPLTDRESEVVSLVSKGLPNKLIALRLGLTEGTVKIHLHNIFKKVDVSNRTELARKLFG